MEKGKVDFAKLGNLTKPRDEAWDNFFTFEKIGDKVEGYIRDVFYRDAEKKGMIEFPQQRGITLEQSDGKLVNVTVKRLSFILNKTDDLRLGDPLRIELTELKKNDGGFDTKILSFFGTNLPENAEQPTVKELDDKDRGSEAPEDDIMPDDDDEISVEDVNEAIK